MPLLLLLSLLLSSSCSSDEKKLGCAGEPLYSNYGIIKEQIKSPDGQKTLTAEVREDAHDDAYVVFRVQAGKRRLTARLYGWNPEVLWSPDSRSFAVNQTEGGGGIGQRAYIFYLGKQRLRKIDVSAPVEKRFGRPVKCEVPVLPNTAVLQWLNPKRILVVAEVVHVSICRCPGTFKSYEMSLPDLKILKIHTQAETQRLYGNALGCEFRQADNQCAKTWQK